MAQFTGEVLTSDPNATAAQEPASAAVAPPSSADQATAKNDAEYEAAKAKLKGDYEDKKKANSMAGMSDVKFGEFETQIPTFFTTPTGMVMAGSAAIGAGVVAKKAGEKAWEAGKKVYGSLRDFSKEKFGDDGLFAAQQAEKAANQTFTPENVPGPITREQVPSNIPASDNIGKKDIEILSGETAGKGKAEVADVVKGAAAPQRTDFQKTLGQPTVTTGSGMPAYVGEGGESAKVKKVFASMKDVPADHVFVPEGRYMDTVRNAVGQELYTSKLREFGGYPLTQEQAHKQSREINQSVGRAARAEAKAAGTPLGENTPSITKQVGKNKLIKVAGVGGALISLSDLAKAESVTEAALRGADIATDYIPVVGQVKQAMTPSTAGAPVVPESRFSEAAKLGSPYYGTEWAKAQRSKPVPPPR